MKFLKIITRWFILIIMVFMIVGCNKQFNVESLNGVENALNSNFNIDYEDVDFTYIVNVSGKGSDTNGDGSENNPVKTLSKAGRLVEDYVIEEGEGNVLIQIDDGEYYLSNGFNITESMIPNNRLYIRAKNPLQAIFSGSKRINNIIETNDNKIGRIWKIPSTEMVYQLFINDRRGVRARYPNVGENFNILNWDKIMKEIYVEKSLTNDVNIIGSSMVIDIMWADSVMRVADLITTKELYDVIKLQTEDEYVFVKPYPEDFCRQTYHFENKKEFLDVAGEWYYDNNEKVVYYKPNDYETIENTIVRIPKTENILSITGDNTSVVERVTIEGIKFAWTQNSNIEGRIGNQAAWHIQQVKKTSDGRAISAVNVSYAKNIVFRNNLFTGIGGTALDLVGGVCDAEIYGNRFYDVGGNGIFGGSTQTTAFATFDSSNIIKNVHIHDNFISKVGQVEKSGTGIAFTYTEGLNIEYNTINHCPYTGIAVGWGWTADVMAQNSTTIYRNEISNTMGALADGGGIYTISNSPNSKIEENYVHDIVRSVWGYPSDYNGWWSIGGIYLDQGTGGYVVTNNCVENCRDDRYKANTIVTTGKNAVVYNFLSNDDKLAVIENAGVRDEYGYVLPTRAYMLGIEIDVDNADICYLYGKNLGNKKGKIIVKDKDGNFSYLNKSNIKDWKDNKITINLDDSISSGEIYIETANGQITNSDVITIGRWYDAWEYSEWGGIEGLNDLLEDTVELTDFNASSTLSGWDAEYISDNNSANGWSCGVGDTSPWISFAVNEDEVSLSKLVIIAREGFDQPETRKNFKIIAGNNADFSDAVIVYAQGNTAFNDSLAVYLNGKSYKYFKIEKTTNEYFFVAEVKLYKVD